MSCSVDELPAADAAIGADKPEGAAPSDGPMDRLGVDTLAGSVVVLLVMTVLQRVIGFGRGMLFCRWLDSEQLGLWDIAFGFINLAAPLAVLGLPGSFGRYVEYYRQRGQLRTFLRRTAAFSGAMTLLAVGGIVLGRDWCAWLVFNRSDLGGLMACLAVTLATVIAFNSLVLLLIAVRLHRLVNTLQFFQSLGFAVLSLVLFEVWQMSTASAVVAFAASSLLCSLAVLGRLAKIWHAAPESSEPLPHRTMWTKVVPFALWMWATNVLYNLFDIVDRYMILHHSGLDIHEALRQVGNYHTSRIIPVLLGAVAGLLGAMLTPHLSHDWESGLQDKVSDRLNLLLKVTSLVLVVAAAMTLLGAPLLFEFGFQNKYAAGLAVLPWTLAYCSWFGLFALAQNYLFCAERAGLSCIALLAGLLLNIGLNLLLLPTWGLHGAVWATALANLASLLLVFVFSAAAGMRIHRGTWLLSLAPIALGGGTVAALAMLLILSLVACCSDWLLDADEKRQLLAGLRQGFRRTSPASLSQDDAQTLAAELPLV
jgi:O-antigen/teichoic acid export membrane protein